MIVVNLYGGPGSGKSSLAAGVFAELKWTYQDDLEINIELCREWAKDEKWAGRNPSWEEVFENQSRLMHQYKDVTLLICDAPLLLTAVYNQENLILHDQVVKEYKKFKNWNFFVKRKKLFNPVGRFPAMTEEEANVADNVIKDYFSGDKRPTFITTIDGSRGGVYKLSQMLYKDIELVRPR